MAILDVQNGCSGTIYLSRRIRYISKHNQFSQISYKPWVDIIYPHRYLSIHIYNIVCTSVLSSFRRILDIEIDHFMTFGMRREQILQFYVLVQNLCNGLDIVGGAAYNKLFKIHWKPCVDSTPLLQWFQYCYPSSINMSFASPNHCQGQSNIHILISTSTSFVSSLCQCDHLVL